MNEAGNNMNICTEAVPAELGLFVCWIDAQDKSAWPEVLKVRAFGARNSAMLMGRPDNWPPNADKLNKVALSDFAAAYAEWRGA